MDNVQRSRAAAELSVWGHGKPGVHFRYTDNNIWCKLVSYTPPKVIQCSTSGDALLSLMSDLMQHAPSAQVPIIRCRNRTNLVLTLYLVPTVLYSEDWRFYPCIYRTPADLCPTSGS